MRHVAHPNNKVIFMEQVFANFPLCGGCSRRERREGMNNDEYYCDIANAILLNGGVTNDTDATNCARDGWMVQANTIVIFV